MVAFHKFFHCRNLACLFVVFYVIKIEVIGDIRQKHASCLFEAFHLFQLLYIKNDHEMGKLSSQAASLIKYKTNCDI